MIAWIETRRYCPECVAALCEVPTVQLPLTVKVVTHPQEKRTKCTGVQAVLLAPNQVCLVDFTDVHKEESVVSGRAAVLFPSDEAVTPDQLNLSKIDTLYVVDRCAKLCEPDS